MMLVGPFVPQAHSVEIRSCGDRECGRPHVVLFDENHQPIAQFVCPDRKPDGDCFAYMLTRAFEEMEHERGSKL
jgi:hypothetical protein